MKKLITILVIVSVCNINAATWYVDSGVVGGSNNGTSWANAWNSFTSITWNSINGGDTVYVSGGPTASSRTYTTPLSITRNGLTNNPIIIKIDASDAARNGTVIMSPGSYISMNQRRYVHVIGEVAGVRKWVFQNNFNTTTREFAIQVVGQNTLYCKWAGLSISNCNNGFNLQGSTGYQITNCAAKQMRGDYIVRSSSSYSNIAGDWDANVIENNEFEIAVDTTTGGGPDGIQNGNNITIRNNTFTIRRINEITSTQHPDVIQAPGEYLDIYNNDFVNVGDNILQMHGWTASIAARRHIHFWNNICRIRDVIDPFPEYIRLYNQPGTLITEISDIIIANNLFMDNNSWVNFTSDVLAGGANPTGSGNKIVNNIWLNSGAGGCWKLAWSANWATNAWQIDGNVYYGTNSVITYKGQNYTANNWVNTFEPRGSVGQPKFVNYAYRQTTVDMNLAADDTVLHNKGVNLDGVLSSNTDKSGNARGSDWSIGPYEMVSAPTVTEKIFNWSSSTYTVSENAGTLTIPCYRTGDTSGANTVAYTTTAGTATAGINYNTVSGTLSYGAGVGTNSVVITINNVNFVGTKTFTVTLSSPTGDGAVIGNIGTATVTINGAGVLAQPPNTPSITSPVDDSVNVELTPTITATDFVDPQSKTHTDTEWIIKNTQDIVLYSTGNGPSTSLVISSGLLDYATEYQTQVRYKNSQNLWSTWSPFATFTTKTAPTPPAGTGSTNVNVYIFNGEIIFNGEFRLKQ
jgi:hypothetical protein